MRYYVVVTFDLKDAESSDYECVKKGLNNIGLANNFPADNGEIEKLPTTTFFGDFEGTSANSLYDDFLSKVEDVFKQCEVNADVFISVGGDDPVCGMNHV